MIEFKVSFNQKSAEIDLKKHLKHAEGHAYAYQLLMIIFL